MALILVGFGVLAYLVALLLLAVFQRQFLYTPFDGPRTPHAAGLTGFTVDHVLASDGIRIPVWRRTGTPGKAMIVHFHGNGGGNHISAERLAGLAARGFSLAALEYRGYMDAPGTPTETAITADAVALIDKLVAEGTPPERIVLYGWSLGSALAVKVAAERKVAALALEAPLTAAVDVAAERFPIFPVRLLMRDPWLSRAAVPRVAAPVLIVHGTEDWIVPVRHGRRMAALFGARATYVEVDGAGHMDLPERGLLDRIAALADTHVPAR